MTVIDCNNRKEEECKNDQRPYQFDCPFNTHRETNGAASPLNDAFYYGDKTAQMFVEWIKLKPTCSQRSRQCDKPIVYVHVGEDFANAKFIKRLTPIALYFGDGDETVHPLSTALDVVAHEFAHWFTYKHSALVYRNRSGGLNEAFSDMTGKAVEYYLYGTNTWTVAADAYKQGNSEALRYMDDPPKDHQSIDHAEKYHYPMNVHYSSGVFNKAFYKLSTTNGWNAKWAWIVMAKANLKYWSKETGWDRAGDGVLDAACDLGYNVHAVQRALSFVGINSISYRCKMQ